MRSRAEKVNRPDPNEYLPQSYFDEHGQKFNKEVPAFIAIQGWMETPDYPTLPPRKMDYFSGKQEGLTDDAPAERAIKNISFGKHREDMGFGNFKTKHSKDSTNIYTDAQENILEQPLENVPKKIGVDSYLADQKKLDATLEKYKELHKGSKIDGQSISQNTARI